ncbi:hypothetical protein [Maribacter aestuarii]|uniref:hypothetical protein n=1 Tax=Maribacter aestuarii TaxID=1130723 RepID=UPI0025A5CFEA|nr:hypothetical protein [Maribacter aestuarii]
MKVTDFTYLLQHPEKVVDPIQTKHLEDIVKEYPYFQTARALHLKGLKNLNSYKYNKVLKNTAAYTTDRDVLFDFITSKNFLQTDFKKVPEAVVEDQIKAERHIIEESIDKPLPQDQKDADQILDPELFKSKDPEVKESKTLQLGEPLSFDANEKYSFTEWLSLASNKPLEKKDENTGQKPKEFQAPKEPGNTKRNPLVKKKFERIDKFIAENPKIVPQEKFPKKIDVSASIKFDKNELMTETLARVYLEQKKYKKAIQAYKILSLKYPEKSGFFADRIRAVEKIQQENK